MPAKPSIVFAPGLWADGSCYSKVIPALEADGHQVVSAQNSLDSSHVPMLSHPDFVLDVLVLHQVTGTA